MKFIRNNIIFILIIIIGIFILKFKLPYYIEAPGGLETLNGRYIINNEYKSKGSFNLTYVSEYDANIPMYIYALINKDYDIVKKKESIPTNSTYEEEKLRGRLMYKDSIDNAIIASYTEANKSIKIINRIPTIIYITKESKSDFKVGDQIIEIDNKKINSKKDIEEILKDSNNKLNVKVINNNKTYNRVVEKTNNKLGILIIEEKKIEEDPKIKISTKSDEYGPSGGLMISLEIYNKLTEFDLTKGLTISGTGTIDEDGNVGSIDGVKYKLKGAVKNKADIFLVPSDNYKEAITLKKKYNYNIKIIKVDTLKEAIKKIKEI